jgi:hypothetical protein
MLSIGKLECYHIISYVSRLISKILKIIYMADKEKKSGLIYFAMGILVIMVLGLGVAVAYLIIQNKDSYQVPDDEEIEAGVSDNEEVTAESTRLDINDGYVNIPTGWTVDAVVSEYRNLPNTELQEACPGGSGGVWPIHERSGITIKREEATIHLEKNPIFAKGGIGGVSTPLAEEYEVVLEPIEFMDIEDLNRDMFGYARKEEGGVYYYHLIVKNENYDPDAEDGSIGSAQYFDMSMGLNDMAEMRFSGDEAYLETADSVYEEACVDNTSGWCRY